MVTDMPGSRPPGDPATVERLAATIRREAGLLHTVDLVDVGSWRGFGADRATGRINKVRASLADVVIDLRALAATLDRMADQLRDDQRAWDRWQSVLQRAGEREAHHAANP